MLESLIHAIGHQVVLELERSSEYSPALPDTPLGRRSRQRRHSLLACVTRQGPSNVLVFESTVRGGDDQAVSDVDVIVGVEKGTGLSASEALRKDRSGLLGVSDDVAPSDSLRPRIRQEVNREAVLL